MPGYYAGWIRGTGVPRFGNSFTVARIGVAGTYKITLPSGLFHSTTVTAVNPNTVARVIQAQIDGLTGKFTVDIEIKSTTTGLPVDGDFNFIALQRS